MCATNTRVQNVDKVLDKYELSTEKKREYKREIKYKKEKAHVLAKGCALHSFHCDITLDVLRQKGVTLE